MIERRSRLYLAQEPLPALGIRRGRSGKYLDGDVAVQLDVAGLVDHAHSTLAERSLYFEMAHPLAGHLTYGTPGNCKASSLRQVRAFFVWLRLGRRLRSPCSLCQVVLIESLPNQGLDDRLAAHVEVLSRLIQFLQHAGSDIHVNALNRLNHAASALEEVGNIFALIG